MSEKLNPHQHSFTGCMTAVVTPMHPHGGIDYAAMEALIEWHIESGTDALVVAGTTGESATLEDDELYEPVSYTHLTLPTIHLV